MSSIYTDEDLLPISALQHFLFCERQCALIHIEQVWEDNVYTIQGELLHRRVHSETAESRPARKTEFGMPVRSLELGLVGKVDVVEYREDGRIIVVEYKRGRPKPRSIDEVQVCAQTLCLEEMLGVQITECALFYGKTKRRKKVPISDDLRSLAVNTARRLRTFIETGKTPPPVYSKERCDRCSLLSLCLPRKLSRSASVDRYFTHMLSSKGEGS